jgi:integrase/recombinase XerD
MELKEYLQKELSQATAARYERDLQLFFFHLKKPREASYQQIMDVLGVLRKKYSNPKTIDRFLAAIKKYYGYLQHIGARKDHPCKGIKLRDGKRRDIQLQDLFSTKELELLLESKPKRERDRKANTVRDKLILSLLVYQGLVRTEISLIEINDINLEEATISAKGDERTNKRTLPLKAKQIHLLYEYQHKERSQTTSKKLFIGMRGEPMSSDSLARIVQGYQYLFAEKTLTCQTIRMSVTRNLLKEGKDVRMVQAYMGHKSPGTTEKYKQGHTEELKAEIQKYHPIK